MRAIVFDGQRARFTQNHRRPVPASAPSARYGAESLVRVELAAICNTDREILRGYRPDFSGIMGHEFVGVVCESDDASLVGRRVVGEINLSCGECLYCATGRPHHCARRATLGINDRDGSFADFLVLPSSLLHLVPDDLAPEQAVYTEPLAAALRVVEQVAFADNMPVAILGDGRLALMACQGLAHTTKAALTVFGRHPEKLVHFAPYATTVCATKGAAATADGFEVVIEATGSPAALPLALRLVRSEGTLVMKSTYAGLSELDMSEVVVREIRIQGSRCGNFEPALALLRSAQLTLPPIELFAPEDFEAAFASTAFKAGLDFRNTAAR